MYTQFIRSMTMFAIGALTIGAIGACDEQTLQDEGLTQVEASDASEGTTGEPGSPHSESTGDDTNGAPQGAEPHSSDLTQDDAAEGACGPNTKEYFVVRAGLGGQSMAIDGDGNVYAWGANDKGQLGIGTVTAFQVTPTKIAGVQKFWDVAGGDKHTLGLAQDGTVWAWGDNSAGQIANTATAIPKKVAGLSDVVQIAAGGRFSLALTAQGKVYAWGDNTYGQLGIGSVGGTRSAPTLVPGLSSPSTIAAGNEFAAAHKGTQLWIWGRDNSGQLGNGVSTTSQGTPTLVALPGIYTFGLGSEHVLAYLPQSAQNWYAWGKNSWGQLGNGGLSNRTSPSPITGPTFLHVSQIYASASATLVAGASGFSPAKPGLELSSTGRNDYRQLLHKLPSPVRILSGMAGVLIEGWDQVAGVSHGYLQNLAAGNGYTLVIAGTTVKAIGLNQAGQLGDGTLTSRSTPTNVCLP